MKFAHNRHDSRYNRATGTDIPVSTLTEPQVNLGAQPGALLAVLPALLGFCPQESLVFIGLSLRSCEGDRAQFRVGPVVRVDMDGDANSSSLRGGAETFSQTLADEPGAAAILVAIHPDEGQCLSWVQAAAESVSEAGIVVQGLLRADEVATGRRWFGWAGNGPGEWRVGGEIGDVERNQVADMSALSGAHRMSSRAEMERWLDPWGIETGKLIACEATSPHHGDLVCLCTAILGIAAGRVTIEEKAADPACLELLDALACDDHLYPVVVALGVGPHAALVRELLAASVRRTVGNRRRRLMLVLALVLTANDEGTLAFHTLNRLVAEARAEADTPDKTGEPEAVVFQAMAVLAAHYRGQTRRVVGDVLATALQCLCHIQMDLEDLDRAMCADAGTDCEDEVPFGPAEEFDAAMDAFDWERISALKSAACLPGRR